jgi:hypothetical protein
MLNFSKLYFVLVTLIFFLSSCDSDNNSVAVEINDYSEQLATDNALLVDYLSTHFYNYQDFPRSENKIVSIEIDTISGDNANKIPLIDQVQQISVPLTDANNAIINHTLYYIVAQQGSELERKPAIVDSTYVAYKGELLSGYKFDERVSPVWFDNASVVSGFRYGLQHFAPGTYSVNESGIIRFQDFGQGIIFMPSGIGYYASGLAAIPNYSPLVFSVSVYTTNESDHDNDGILSKNEDPDGDGNPFNDDTDSDGILNFNDIDDDGDGILTYNEFDKDKDGVVDDTDNDGTPDYLDSDS